jgi:hypothetical protein
MDNDVKYLIIALVIVILFIVIYLNYSSLSSISLNDLFNIKQYPKQ